MSVRTSWKQVIENARPTLDAGQEYVVQTPAPGLHIALRAAAMKAGYTARMRGPTTVLSKGETMVTQYVVPKRIVQMRPRPEWTPLWPRPTDLLGCCAKFAAHAYWWYTKYSKQGPGFRTINTTNDRLDLVHTQMSETVWWVIANEDLTYDQPSHLTLDSLLNEIYERDAFDQPTSLKAIANACARLPVSNPWQFFNDTNVQIPVMTPQEALANMERLVDVAVEREVQLKALLAAQRGHEDREKIYDIND